MSYFIHIHTAPLIITSTETKVWHLLTISKHFLRKCRVAAGAQATALRPGQRWQICALKMITSILISFVTLGQERPLAPHLSCQTPRASPRTHVNGAIAQTAACSFQINKPLSMCLAGRICRSSAYIFLPSRFFSHLGCWRYIITGTFQALLRGDLGRSIWAVGTMQIHECSLSTTGGEDPPAPETTVRVRKRIREGGRFWQERSLKWTFGEWKWLQNFVLNHQGCGNNHNAPSGTVSGGRRRVSRVPSETGLSVRERVWFSRDAEFDYVTRPGIKNLMTHQLSLGRSWQLFLDPNGLMNKAVKNGFILYSEDFLH